MVMLLEHLVLLNATRASTFDTVLMGTSYQTSNIFTGLAAGTYTVTLQDAKVVLLLIRLQLVNRILVVINSSVPILVTDLVL
jgi:hypothetical protein